jgi:cell pole-organizing protein PopZ
MSLRNRLASLNSRTKADTQRSFASLLGGDVRAEEARVREQQFQTPSQDLQPYVHEEFTETISSTMAYAPDYHDWSLEHSLYNTADEQLVESEHRPVRQSLPDAGELPMTSDEELGGGVLFKGTLDEYEAETGGVLPEEDEEQTGDLLETDGDPVSAGDTLPLEAMIRQVIEPELTHWFDVHLPEHVARAMPNEDAFISMIRPLIEEWLQDNLEPIVERAVRDEIARITGLKR